MRRPGGSKWSALRILCVVFLLPMASAKAQEEFVSSQLRFHSFGPEHGLLSQELSSIARDSKGFVWIATYAGLFRYDGYRFKQFVHDPDDANSLSGNRVRSVVVDKKDRVWVGTESNGVTMYDPSTHTFLRYGNDPENPESYFAGQTLFIEELPDGSMAFMVFGDGMVRILPDLATLERYRHDAASPESLSSNVCLAADVDAAGYLWVACLGGSLQRLDTDTGTFVDYEEQIEPGVTVPLDRVTVIMFDRNNTMWLGTDGIGLMRKPSDSKTLEHLHPDTAPFSLTPDFVTRLMEDEDGRIWIGYRDAGIDVIDWSNQSSNRIEHVPGRDSSLSSNNTFAITQDREGLIWVPTWGAGLNVANPRNVDVKIYESDPESPGVFSSNSEIRMLHELKDGRLLLASRDKKPALFSRDGDRLVLDRILQLPPGDEPPVWVFSALEDRYNRIWIPTVGRGLYIYDLKTNSANLVPGTDSWNLVSIFEDSSGTIWTSEFSRGVFTINSQTQKLQSIGSEFSGVSPQDLGPVLDMLESADKAIWMGTRSGVFRLSPDRRELTRVQSISVESNQERIRSARAMTIDRAGRLWIAGEQISYTSEPFASEPEFIFPFDNTPYSGVAANTVLEDNVGRMWFTIPEGVLGFDPETGQMTLFDDSMDVPLNAPDQGGKITRSNELVYAGLRRLTIVSPTIFDRNKIIKAPTITRLVIGGREVYDTGAYGATNEANIRITPEDRDFTIEYASLSPINASSYTYAHKLEGFDRDWIYTDASRRFATYTNLPPGSYTLHMNVIDRNGRPSPAPSFVSINVLPAFYQTLWFQALMASLVLLALYAIYRARLAVLQASQRRLEQLVAERTQKVERQKTELADRNVRIEQTMSELKETQGKLVQSEKLAALGGLVAGVAHEVNTPIGLVVSGASQIESETAIIKDKLAGEKITKSDLERFLDLSGDLGRLTLRNAQKAADMIKSFKLVSADQSSQQIIDIQIVPYLRDVMISVKPLLTEKGHSATVSGDEHIQILINAGALSQIITNLVTNAVTHAFEPNETGEINIDVTQTSDAVTIVVTDNGCGISEIHQSKIFDPFFTTKRGQGNTGLGLHIVHNLVLSAFEGTVDYRQSDDGGSVFTINIPKK